MLRRAVARALRWWAGRPFSLWWLVLAEVLDPTTESDAAARLNAAARGLRDDLQKVYGITGPDPEADPRQSGSPQ
jgi:hypothetical protein